MYAHNTLEKKSEPTKLCYIWNDFVLSKSQFFGFRRKSGASKLTWLQISSEINIAPIPFSVSLACSMLVALSLPGVEFLLVNGILWRPMHAIHHDHIPHLLLFHPDETSSILIKMNALLTNEKYDKLSILSFILNLTLLSMSWSTSMCMIHAKKEGGMKQMASWQGELKSLLFSGDNSSGHFTN